MVSKESKPCLFYLKTMRKRSKIIVVGAEGVICTRNYLNHVALSTIIVSNIVDKLYR